jgi:hypothetical protein
MSDSPSFNFTNNVDGDGTNIAQGQAVTQTITQNFGNSVTPDQVVDAIAQAIPEPVRDEVMEPIRAEIKQLAAVPVADVPKETVLEKASKLAEKLIPYAPQIGTRIAVFTEAALSTIAPPVGWLISGILATVRSVNGSKA